MKREFVTSIEAPVLFIIEKLSANIVGIFIIATSF